MSVITTKKPTRLEAIESLPREIQDHALIDWQTLTLLLARKDVEGTREWARSQGLRLVDTGRRKLPTWKSVRELLKSCEILP